MQAKTLLLLLFIVYCRAQIELTDELAAKERKLIHSLCGKSSNIIYHTILNGYPAELGEFPWMALLGYKLVVYRRSNVGWPQSGVFFKCGGSLITNQHVITAAHCLHRETLTAKKGDLTAIYQLSIVRLGELDYDPKAEDHSPSKDYHVERIIIHKGWNNYNKINDLGIVKLKEKVTFTEYIRPICLPPKDLRLKTYVDELPTVAGWGKIGSNKNATTSNRLMKVDVKVADKDYCRGNLTSLWKTVKVKIDDSVICAGTKDKDSCQGDSGGPLMYNRIPADDRAGGDRYYLIGVVSYGRPCGSENYPAVYTNVTHHLSWILESLDI